MTGKISRFINQLSICLWLKLFIGSTVGAIFEFLSILVDVTQITYFEFLTLTLISTFLMTLMCIFTFNILGTYTLRSSTGMILLDCFVVSISIIAYIKFLPVLISIILLGIILAFIYYLLTCTIKNLLYGSTDC